MDSNAARQRWKNRKPGAYRRMLFKINLKAKHGITLERWDVLLLASGGLCGICSVPMIGYNEPAVDHCHATEARRGLLCQACNKMLGYAKDRPVVLRAAAAYLEEK